MVCHVGKVIAEPVVHVNVVVCADDVIVLLLVVLMVPVPPFAFNVMVFVVPVQVAVSVAVPLVTPRFVLLHTILVDALCVLLFTLHLSNV